jgi:multiple sugar transport system permease protein
VGGVKTRTRTYVWQYAVLALYVLFIATPVVWLFTIAFKSEGEISTVDPAWLPSAPTLDNFTTALSEQPLVRAALNSFLISGTASALTVLLALPPGYMMARYRGVVSHVALGWVLLSQMFPFILILVPLFMTMVQLGLYDKLFGLILVYTVWNLPFAIWMLRNFVEGIPVDLEEQAAIDGASRVEILRHVVLPLLVPGVVTATMFTFINSWNEFFFALVLIKDEAASPLSVMLVRFIGLEGAVRLGPLAAASLLATLPSLLFFFAIQRRLTSGLVAGAVKG